jgi:hypothetical protein
MKHLLIDCTWVLICCTHHYYILSSDHEWNALGLLPYCLKRFMGWAEGVIVKFVQKGVIYSLSLRETARTAPASWTLNDPWWALSWSDLTWPALVFEQKRVKRTVIPHRPRVRLVMLNSFHPAQVMIVASSERRKKKELQIPSDVFYDRKCVDYALKKKKTGDQGINCQLCVTCQQLRGKPRPPRFIYGFNNCLTFVLFSSLSTSKSILPRPHSNPQYHFIPSCANNRNSFGGPQN